MMFDLPPLPKLWMPPRPAIVRAASMKDIAPYLAMPFIATFASGSVRGLRGAGAAPFGATTDAMPTMTSASAPSGVVSASSYLAGGYDPWKAAADDATDNTALLHWITNAATTGWWQYQFASATGIGGYSIRCGTTGHEDRMPKTWTLKASLTGAFAGEEITLDTQTGVAAFTSGLRRSYTFTNTVAYLYYRLGVTLNQGNATYLQIGEIELLH